MLYSNLLCCHCGGLRTEVMKYRKLGIFKLNILEVVPKILLEGAVIESQMNSVGSWGESPT